MATVKLTCWNVEHFGRILTSARPQEVKRLQAVTHQFRELNADIIALLEAPLEVEALRRWLQSPDGLRGEYRLVTLAGLENETDPKVLRREYAISGTQFIWFLVRSDLAEASGAIVQPPRVWQSLTGRKQWPVYYWGRGEREQHDHFRHPQVLLLNLAGKPVEIIAAHLKSKINQEIAFGPDGRLTPAYVKEATDARIKLTTEAYDVRRYIDARFAAEPNPRIFLVGDLNDGPGREHFEREYLFMDLVTNVQGDVFFAKRYLNHALFDYPEEHRWTTRFRDRIDEWSRSLENAEADLTPESLRGRQLLDHILFTQALVDKGDFPQIRRGAGLVEHTIHTKTRGLFGVETSDHRPVSVHIETGP